MAKTKSGLLPRHIYDRHMREAIEVNGGASEHQLKINRTDRIAAIKKAIILQFNKKRIIPFEWWLEYNQLTHINNGT